LSGKRAAVRYCDLTGQSLLTSWSTSTTPSSAACRNLVQVAGIEKNVYKNGLNYAAASAHDVAQGAMRGQAMPGIEAELLVNPDPASIRVRILRSGRDTGFAWVVGNSETIIAK
jgi:hypothetical protein